MFSAQNLLLKSRAGVHTNDLKRKLDVFTTKKCFNIIGNDINLRTRRADRIRK